jgi:hypothetical protein
MSTSLAAIRARLAAQDNKSQGNQERSAQDNALYPFWNMNEGDTSNVRFLADGDTTNPYFWIEKAMIKLPFTGVKGKADSKNYIVQVPCMEMWGENCPILAEVRTWYKDESLKEMANKYWKKRTYLFQGFVRTNAVADDKTPENPIRRFTITPQIFSIIKASLMDPEIEELPTDTLRGLDFKIVKTQKGGYADYSTSGWARKESALTEAEQAAIAQFGLFDLKEFLPKKPTDAEQRIIKEMFEASVDGRPYDADKWAAYYKPWGLDTGTSGSSTQNESAPAPVARPQPAVAAPVAQPAATETPPWEEDAQEAAESIKVPTQPAAPSSDKANDILAMIRSRQKTA